MRKLLFDQYEFDEPSAEQTLEVAISSVPRHGDLPSFLTECGATLRDGMPATQDWSRWAEIAANMRRFAGIEVVRNAGSPFLLLNDDWDDCEVAFQSGSLFVWYHWWTTAEQA